jgi:hypothetical protein
MLLSIVILFVVLGIILYKHPQNFKAEAVAFFAIAVVALVSSVKVTIMSQPEPKGLKEDSLKVIFHKPDTIKTSQVDEYSSSECHYNNDNHYGNCIHCNQ